MRLNYCNVFGNTGSLKLKDFKISSLNKLIKYITSKTWQPTVAKYLSVTRKYSYNGIHLVISPQVFHPGFFLSTKVLLKYIEKIQVADKRFLELGAGNGLISFSTAKRKAIVTATDINPVAIEYLKSNSKLNHSSINIIFSNLFNDIPAQQFDIIAINPPFYKKDPVTDAEHAWYCGTNGEYFSNLFYSLSNYMSAESVVLMILSEDCDLRMINHIAQLHSFEMKLIEKRKVLWLRHFIFKIVKSNVTFIAN